MFEIIARDFPRLVAALRRSYGMNHADAVALILSARYGQRANVWTAENCATARRTIAGAFASRSRLVRVAA